MVSKKKVIISYFVVIMLLMINILYSVLKGSINLNVEQLFKGLFISYDQNVAVVYDLRFPRIIISLLAGMSLAISGVLLQAVMQNPLTDPGIIGISSAASLSSTLILILFPQIYMLAPFIATCGGILAYLLLYALSWKGGSEPIRMVLVGVALNMTFTGITQMFSVISHGNLTGIQSIIEGNVAQKTWLDVKIIFIYCMIGVLLSILTIKPCNLLALEDNTAKSIGVNVDRNRFLVALVGIILASSATAIVGIIGFIGLIVPHIARSFVGSDHKNLIPFSGLLGALFLLSSDTFGRLIAYPFEISAAVIMTVLGGPFFIILLKIKGASYGD